MLGKLRIGSSTCRLRNKVTIELYGSRYNQTVPADPWVKGIWVSEGQLDIHGVQYFPTWTRLARTANINDTVIFVQDLVNWEVGQSFVITTSELKDTRDFNRNEKLIITGVYQARKYGPNVSAITIKSSLKFKHYGGREYQCEVGLLNRRIMIKGMPIKIFFFMLLWHPF